MTTEQRPPLPDGNDRCAAPAIDLQSAPVEDPALQARRQPWVEMECYQLRDGRRLVEMDTLDLGSQKIVRELQKTSVHKLGRTPADFCTVSICTPDPDFRFSEHCGDHADTVFFMPADVEFDIHIPAGGDCAYVGFSQEEFLRGARALNPAAWEHPPQGVVPLASRGHRAFKDAVDLWLKTAHEASLRGGQLDPAMLRNRMLHSVLQIAAVSEDHIAPSFNERIRAYRIGRQALAFIDERSETDELPTVVDICTAIGVSERTLRYAFHEYVGLSPLAYLRASRLNRVRAVLTASDPQQTTVTQVAMRFGFLHFSRFAGDYKRMFGKTPSETLSA